MLILENLIIIRPPPLYIYVDIYKYAIDLDMEIKDVLICSALSLLRYFHIKKNGFIFP